MFSATDVANFLACHQLLFLDCAHALGEIERPYFPDPGIELLRELGAKHEQSYLRHQRLPIGRRMRNGSTAWTPRRLRRSSPHSRDWKRVTRRT
jgi:hypothetical protein